MDFPRIQRYDPIRCSVSAPGQAERCHARHRDIKVDKCQPQGLPKGVEGGDETALVRNHRRFLR
jgi:hypothetical protein